MASTNSREVSFFLSRQAAHTGSRGIPPRNSVEMGFLSPKNLRSIAKIMKMPYETVLRTAQAVVHREEPNDVGVYGAEMIAGRIQRVNELLLKELDSNAMIDAYENRYYTEKLAPSHDFQKPVSRIPMSDGVFSDYPQTANYAPGRANTWLVDPLRATVRVREPVQRATENYVGPKELDFEPSRRVW